MELLFEKHHCGFLHALARISLDMEKIEDLIAYDHTTMNTPVLV